MNRGSHQGRNHRGGESPDSPNKAIYVVKEQQLTSSGSSTQTSTPTPPDSDSVDNVGTQLQELTLSLPDPEEIDISEDQLTLNHQLQEDELLAMQAIYGNNLTILKRGGQRSFQIHIPVETSDEFSVTARLTSSNKNVNLEGQSKSPVNAADNLDEFIYSFRVQHLPPVVLKCVLPRSYPSHRPPCFTISIQWLDSLRISQLCEMLDSIWAYQPGQEVIYQWVESLHSSCLSYLGIDNELVLTFNDTTSTGEMRAVSGSESPEVDIPLMMNYNNDKCYETFCENLQECCICFCQYAGTEFIRLPCNHFFCRKCMETFSSIHVKEGTVKLLCPDAKCGGLVPPGLLKQLLRDEEFVRWESLLLQKTLDLMSDVVYCPRCDTACLEDQDNHALCSKCLFSFCSLCRARRHVGVACMTPELKLQILKEQQKLIAIKEEQKHKERELINEILSLQEIQRNSKQCPSCSMAISRIDGCNKMVCKNCGKFFCYRCNKAIDGYDHYRGSGCTVFQPVVQVVQPQITERQLECEIRSEMYGERSHPCPTCRQLNPKVGNNNHIFCWACQSHYCYLCRKVVRRCSEHFGPKGCKQHTED